MERLQVAGEKSPQKRTWNGIGWVDSSSPFPPHLEDHPRTDVSVLGSPLFTSHGVRPFIRGITLFRGQKR